ncbi:MAG: GNAT family N-acetyltransferase [Nanoarchaeota archaeon]
MIYTLNKHVRWRKDKKAILICDCKRLLDLKISFDYEQFVKKLFHGVSLSELDDTEKKVFSDFKKMKLLSNLEIKQIKDGYFSKAMQILDNELGKGRVRSSEFLHEKFKKFNEFFIGIFLDKEIIGVICGFPRDDYFLMSELAVDSRFHNRGFGKKLVLKFEEITSKKYNKINVGALDNSIYFYSSLKYAPFLLIQFKNEDYDVTDFNKFRIIRSTPGAIEANVNKTDLNELEKLRKEYPKANFQYIFSKKLNN